MSRFKPPQKAKRDASEAEVVAALRGLGFTVYRLDQPVDLALAKGGKTWLAECKSEGEKLRPSQKKFIDGWAADVPVFRSTDDVLEWANLTGGRGL